MKPPVLCLVCQTPNRLVEGRDNRGAKCGKCGAPLFPEIPVAVTDATFERVVMESPIPVLLDLWAPWCGPCRMVAPVLEDLSRKYHGLLRVAKLNVDENPRTAARMEAKSIPLLLFVKDGSVAGRLVGAHPASEIEKGLRSIL